MKLMITQEKDMLIISGLIMKNRSGECIWLEGQWCPPGLRRSQNRRVQRLRNQELKQAWMKRKQVWRPKDKPDGSGRSAPTCMACFLPNEFMALANQVVQEETSPDINEDEQLGLMAQLVLASFAVVRL
jgi:hypothetical protein